MHLSHVARLLAGFLLFFSLTLVVPLAVAWTEESRFSTAPVFATSLGIGLGAAFLLWLAGRRSQRELFRKEGLAVVGLSWGLAGAVAAIPFYGSGALPLFVDAYFEAVSGLTTTGATVFGIVNPQIEELPESLLLWRSMLQWLGGMGIILVFIVLLPGVGVTGSRLLSSEQVGGVGDESIRPRMAKRARQLFAMYVSLTVAAGLSYWIAGLSSFDALCHALTTIATGGFSPHNASIGGYQNLPVELVAIVFMFLAGCNFLLLVTVITRGGRSESSVVRLVEFRVYLGLMVVVALGMTLSLWLWGEKVIDPTLGLTRDYSSFGRCLRDGTFQSVALLTGTGYCSANFQNWPELAIGLLLLCMFIGGCAGSTTGGFKIFRVVVCAKLIRYSMRQFVRPRGVAKLKIGPEVIADSLVSAIMALLLLWIVTVLAGAFVLHLDPRVDLVSAFTVSLSMMGCVGPSISGVVPADAGTFELIGKIDVGPYGGYGELHPGAKLFMTGQMVLGRLEILAPLALLTPGFWKR